MLSERELGQDLRRLGRGEGGRSGWGEDLGRGEEGEETRGSSWWWMGGRKLSLRRREEAKGGR